MARTLTVYVAKDGSHTVLAHAITKADIEAGRGGAVGDFYVSRNGFKIVWNERAPFLEAYELLKSPRSASDDDDRHDDVAAEIEALAPAPAPADPAQLTRTNFAQLETADESKGYAELLARIEALERADLEQAKLYQDVISAGIEARRPTTEVVDRLEALESTLGKLETALGIVPAELEQLDAVDGSAAAAEGDAGEPTKGAATKKRGGK